MGILAWIVFGLIAGVVASFIMKSGYGIVGDIIVGIVGAIIGGFLGNTLFGLNVTGFNVQSFLVAIVGAIILIAALRAFSGNRARV